MLSVSLAIVGFAALAVAQTPNVSLLTDLPLYKNIGSRLTPRQILPLVSARKGQQFHFGSTWDQFDPKAEQAWQSDRFWDTWNHVVGENSCKWYDTEPTRNNFTLGDCKAVSAFAGEHGATFRGHNTFWHQQLPAWLPDNVTASDLVNNVIPNHIKGVMTGMGRNVTSWDVMNELIGDSVTLNMTALECVLNKGDWPTVTRDGGNVTLVPDLSFVHAAYKAALKYDPGKLVYNDYSTGGQQSFSLPKTSCVMKLLADIHANASVPYNRLGVGFQSHLTARPNYFPSKPDLTTSFANLAALGADALITEMDCSVVNHTTADYRYQAAIWGDTLDACLYAKNCHEFINWDNRDDNSWRGNSSMATLFDVNGLPKLNYYEVLARLEHFATWQSEPCATSSGTSVCTLTAPWG